jgi:NifU-like protein involved in Fe-S cluster formation
MDYSPQIWQRFRQPRYSGKLEGAGLVAGEARTPASKAVLRLQLRVTAGRVEAARFLALGCPSTVAAADWLCEWLEGRELAEAGSLSATDLAQALELVAVRRHCAVLAEDALRAVLQVSGQGAHGHKRGTRG